MAARPSGWTRHDLGLYVAAAGASVVGALLVWSATARTTGSAYLVRHLLTAGLGLAVAVLVSRAGRGRVRAAAPWAWAAAVLLLLLVPTPLGTTVNGSRSWIPLVAGFTLQPAELAKADVTLALAALLAGRLDRGSDPGGREVLLAGVVLGVPTLLVLLQPDLGTALVLAALGAVVVVVGGVPRRWVAAGAALLVAGVVLALTTPLLSGYQRARLTSFADPTADPQGAGYQVRQVRLAIGGGGLWGQGFMDGTRTQGGFVPFQLNDFVFSVAGEELGFVGAAGLVLLLGVVVVRALVVAARAEDAFGRLVGVGVATWLAVQVVQNVGMNLGLLPVTGLPLPFVSYGGSSMLASWLAIGLVDAARAGPVPR
ncbi:FtsW/RodA/SpoVE family cell cycle protein [Phycicoccus sp. HDW14]|uniref:FtsW/RodA/SpoVE family cell cycle protein n=1 Tax=Phycicoccus sp. HDW14 TaxID=2714941 RepID=UPI00140A0A40|nr:FtsW/RodA/SpoVE family cell cycle protein [Phycicoccus sp. HDW14]QIM20491.1 FtsW/RodA/SpoVE family cell cycle protein [Phycicoccus sp. HDW14]